MSLSSSSSSSSSPLSLARLFRVDLKDKVRKAMKTIRKSQSKQPSAVLLKYYLPLDPLEVVRKATKKSNLNLDIMIHKLIGFDVKALSRKYGLLHSSIINESFRGFIILIALGADVNSAPPGFSNYPIEIALRLKKYKYIDVLIQLGARIPNRMRVPDDVPRYIKQMIEVHRQKHPDKAGQVVKKWVDRFRAAKTIQRTYRKHKWNKCFTIGLENIPVKSFNACKLNRCMIGTPAKLGQVCNNNNNPCEYLLNDPNLRQTSVRNIRNRVSKSHRIIINKHCYDIRQLICMIESKLTTSTDEQGVVEWIPTWPADVNNTLLTPAELQRIVKLLKKNRVVSLPYFTHIFLSLDADIITGLYEYYTDRMDAIKYTRVSTLSVLRQFSQVLEQMIFNKTFEELNQLKHLSQLNWC